MFSHDTSTKAHLTLETLEDRTVPSVTSAFLSGGTIFLSGNNNAANAYVYQSGSNVVVSDTSNGFTRSFAAYRVQRVQFVGGAGNDRFIDNVSWLPVRAWGNGGNDYLEGYNANDTLVGGAGNDTLKGFGGSDHLYGGDNDDKLFGGSGYDFLYGQNHSDFLDGGSSSEYLNGGTGYDFNARVVAVYGASRSDVRQGGASDCWLFGGVAAVAGNVNLASRISYLGSGLYRVNLFTSGGQATSQYVTFDGSRWGADARPNPTQEGESWVIITARAVLQQLGMSTTNPPAGNPGDAMAVLTGRPSTWYGQPSSSQAYYNSDAERILAALRSHQNVALCTHPQGTPLATSKLVNWHSYTVVGMTRTGSFGHVSYLVTVRNPWGYDGGSGSGTTTDGYITLTWSEFSRSIQGYSVN